MTENIRVPLCRLLSAVYICAGALQAQNDQIKPCAEVAGLMVSQFIMDVPTQQLRRVELRKCGPEVSETLQIVAWEQKAAAPGLVLDTKDFTVVQAVMSGKVFVIETTGGPRDRVYVVVFTTEGPKLALERVTRAQARITSDGKAVRLDVPNTWTGKTEQFSFPRE